MTLLTDTLAALLWVGGAILLVLAVHRAARRFMPQLGEPVALPARQQAQRHMMHRGIAAITSYRHMRQEVAARDFGLVFRVPALVGLILFFIQGFASPFTPPFRTPPGAFERLLETDIGTTAVLPRAEVEARAARYRGTRP